MFWACTTLGGQGLSGGSLEHWEGETSLGAIGEVAEEGRSRPNRLSKVLPRGGTGGAPFWGRKLGLDRNDAAKNGGGTRGVLAAVGGDDYTKAGG